MTFDCAAPRLTGQLLYCDQTDQFLHNDDESDSLLYRDQINESDSLLYGNKIDESDSL